jgi:chemotaxis protein MotB
MGNNRKSKKLKNDDESPQGFEIVFSGFVLILLCFFIMLSSFASIEDSRVTRFVKSFTTAVSILSGGLSLDPGKTIVVHSAHLVDKNSELSIIFDRISEMTRHFGLEKKVAVSVSERGTVMRLSDNVLFDLGKAQILPEAVPFLEKICSIIRETTADIHIEGHTDDLPIRTLRFPSNWELSTARAVNCLRYFVEKGNISPKRVSAVGFGEFHPVAPNDSPQSRAKNRRVEIVFIEKDRGASPSGAEK